MHYATNFIMNGISPPPLPPSPLARRQLTCALRPLGAHANQIWSAFSNLPQYSLWLFGLVLEPRSQDVAILIVFIQNTAQTLKYNYLVSVAYKLTCTMSSTLPVLQLP